MTVTVIQTVAAIVQAVAAVVFLIGLVFDFRRRRQERRDALIEKLFNGWNRSTPSGRTEYEASGIYSTRQIDFFNACLRQMGQRWTYRDPLVEANFETLLIFQRLIMRLGHVTAI
jgi:hypothetical protein